MSKQFFTGFDIISADNKFHFERGICTGSKAVTEVRHGACITKTLIILKGCLFPDVDTFFDLEARIKKFGGEVYYSGFNCDLVAGKITKMRCLLDKLSTIEFIIEYRGVL